MAWWSASVASNHRLSPLCDCHKLAMLRTCLNVTLAVDLDVKPQLCILSIWYTPLKLAQHYSHCFVCLYEHVFEFSSEPIPY